MNVAVVSMADEREESEFYGAGIEAPMGLNDDGGE